MPHQSRGRFVAQVEHVDRPDNVIGLSVITNPLTLGSLLASELGS